MKRGTGNRLQFKWTARGPDQLPSVQDVFDAWRHHTVLLFDWCSGFFLLSGDISKSTFRHNCVAAGIPVAESVVPKHHQHFHGYGYCLRAVGLDAEVLSDAQMRRALKSLMVMVNDTLDCAEPVFMALKMWSDLTDETIFETEKACFSRASHVTCAFHVTYARVTGTDPFAPPPSPTYSHFCCHYSLQSTLKFDVSLHVSCSLHLQRVPASLRRELCHT